VEQRNALANWVNNPNKAALRRKMGIKADISPSEQNALSREIRAILKAASGQLLNKAWSWYDGKGLANGMIQRGFHLPACTCLLTFIRGIGRNFQVWLQC
jgi:hypothetical protein